MIKGKIDALLKNYFNNYDESNFELGLMSGSVKLSNLDFNTEKVNRDLDVADVPLKMKLGLLFNLNLKISYLSLKLELLEIENLTLVMEPIPENMSTIDEPYTEQEVE